MIEQRYFFIIILNETKQYKNLNCLGTFNEECIKNKDIEYIKEKIIDYKDYEYIEDIILINKLNETKYNILKNNTKLNIEYEIYCVEEYEYTLEELYNLINDYKPQGNPFISKDYDKFQYYCNDYINKYIEKYHIKLLQENNIDICYNYYYEDEYELYNYITTQKFEFYFEDITINCEIIDIIYDDGNDSRHVNNKSKTINIIDDDNNEIKIDRLNNDFKKFVTTIENIFFYMIN